MIGAMTGDVSATAGVRLLAGPAFPVPAAERHFEDYEVGVVREYGYVTVTEAEILAFARQFDPQPLHTDPDAAAVGPFGGLIASGWHTAGVFMRLLVDHYLPVAASLASPGVDELRWPAPVRPGDMLRMRVTTTSARPSQTKPDRGLIHTTGELLNRNDRCVLSLVGMNIVRRRSASRS